MNNSGPSKQVTETLAALERLLGSPVPSELKVLHAAGASLIRYETAGMAWTFPAPDKLLEIINVCRMNRPYIHQLEGYASVIARRVSVESVPIEGVGEMSLARLGKAWTIADSDGDLLFLDPGSDFSVWVFFHDGSTVRREASNLYDWVCNAKKHLPETLSQHVPTEILKLCVEDALRDYVRHVLIPQGMLKSEDFLTSIAGHTVFNRKQGLVVERLAELITRLHGLDPQKDRGLRDRLFAEISQLSKSVLRT